jgi:hypothetical protein
MFPSRRFSSGDMFSTGTRLVCTNGMVSGAPAPASLPWQNIPKRRRSKRAPLPPVTTYPEQDYNWMEIQSSWVQGIAYTHTGQKLLVRTSSGPVYEFRDVPRSEFTKLAAAVSKGQYVNQYIKGKYSSRRVS